MNFVMKWAGNLRGQPPQQNSLYVCARGGVTACGMPRADKTKSICKGASAYVRELCAQISY